MTNFVKMTNLFKERKNRFEKRIDGFILLVIIAVVIGVLSTIFYGYCVYKCDSGRGERSYCRIANVLRAVSEYNRDYDR